MKKNVTHLEGENCFYRMIFCFTDRVKKKQMMDKNLMKDMLVFQQKISLMKLDINQYM